MKLFDIIKENEKPVDEQLGALAKVGKATKSVVLGAIDDVLKFTAKDGKVITDVAKTPLTTVDDVLKAIKAGKLSPTGASQLASGLLKTNKLPRNLQIDLVTEIAAGPKFKDILGSVKSEAALVKRLKTKGYTDETIELFVGRAKDQKLGPWSTAVKKPATGSSTKPATGSSTKTSKPSTVEPKTLLGKVSRTIGNAAAKLKPSSKLGKSILGFVGRRLKFWGLFKLLTVLAALGIGGTILYNWWLQLRSMFDGDPTDSDLKEMNDWVECILVPLQDDDDAELLQEGDEIVLKYNIDQFGGEETGGYVKFYDNKVVKSANGKTGKWSCNKTGLLNEQESSSDLTAAQISRVIDSLEDQLNGDVIDSDSTDMSDALKVLKGVVGKTYKGKDAISVIKSNYPKITGMELKDHVEELSNLNFQGMESKEEFLSIIGASAVKRSGDSDSSNTSPSTEKGDGNKKTGLSHLNVVWDSKEGGTVVPEKGKGGIKYRPCSDFPFTVGCINDKIKDIQGCLNKLGSVLKVDGYFGPITLKEMAAQSIFADDETDVLLQNNSITKEIYDRLMARCKDKESKDDGKVKREKLEPIKTLPIKPIALPALDPKAMIDKHGLEKLNAQIKMTIDGQRIQDIIDNKLRFTRGRYILDLDEELTPDQLNAINRYLSGKGFSLTKKKETMDDARYVWVADDRDSKRKARIDRRIKDLENKKEKI